MELEPLPIRWRFRLGPHLLRLGIPTAEGRPQWSGSGSGLYAPRWVARLCALGTAHEEIVVRALERGAADAEWAAALEATAALVAPNWAPHAIHRLLLDTLVGARQRWEP